MSTIPVVFSRGHHASSLALRTAMWSPWSHCGLLRYGTVIDATVSHGVSQRSLDDMLRTSSKHRIIELPCKDPGLAYAAAESQVGKTYDWGMVLGHPFRQDWENMDKWSCSELVAWAIAEGGTELFRVKPARITPYHLYLPLFAVPDEDSGIGSVPHPTQVRMFP